MPTEPQLPLAKTHYIALLTLWGIVFAPRLISAQITPFDLQLKRTAADAGTEDWFGRSAAISGDTVIIGAHYNNDPGEDSGSAYIFQRDYGGSGQWAQRLKLVKPDLDPILVDTRTYFGGAVAISGDLAIVGAPGGRLGGAACIYRRDQGGSNQWGLVKKLVASNPEFADAFGYTVGISGDTAVVGAYWNSLAAIHAGSAYIFQRHEGGTDNWGEVLILTASDAQVDGLFGSSVAISGDLIVVGASGVDSAYLFHRNEGGPANWGQLTELIPESAEGNFGSDVAISGDTVIVSAHSAAPGGLAYVFQEAASGAWQQTAVLAPSDDATNFGLAVAISDDLVVVGDRYGQQDDVRTGTAYVFHRNEGGPKNWGEVAKLSASDALADDHFGGAVGVDAGVVVVGAWQHDSAATNAGAGYIFYSSVCGDGQIEGSEECDDKNLINDDECTNNCLLPRCGDGIIQAGEECDDGNEATDDACLGTCESAVCGDGFVYGGVEQCDDANLVDDDACTNGCRLPACGDGIRQAVEECDDGNSNNNDACTSLCRHARCGDGFAQPPEQCDDGNTIQSDSCTSACENARCGDGFVQPEEECDDGNNLAADGCSPDCQLQPVIPAVSEWGLLILTLLLVTGTKVTFGARSNRFPDRAS